MKNFILNRLKEMSTWTAILGFAAVFGLDLTTDQIGKLATAGAGVVAAIIALTSDKNLKKVVTLKKAPPVKEPEPERWHDETP